MDARTPCWGVVGDIVDTEDPDGTEGPRGSREKNFCVELPKEFDEEKGDRGQGSGTESENTDDARLDAVLA